MNPKTVLRLRQALRELVDAERPEGEPQADRRPVDHHGREAERRPRGGWWKWTPICCPSSKSRSASCGPSGAVGGRVAGCGTPKAALYAEADERIDPAVSSFCGLRGVLESADPAHQREVMRQTVDKVEVWTTKEHIGRQDRYLLDKGRVHLREQEQLVTLTKD